MKNDVEVLIDQLYQMQQNDNKDREQGPSVDQLMIDRREKVRKMACLELRMKGRTKSAYRSELGRSSLLRLNFLRKEILLEN
jgi:hypothetical protein